MNLPKRRQHSLTRWVMAGLFLSTGILPSVLQADSANLSTWRQQGPLPGGRWVLSSDKKSVSQTINGYPTFYVSPNRFINGIVRGNFEVYMFNDDDFIGFVFGYQSPIIGKNDASDNTYLLFDWKQGLQEQGKEGFSLTHIRNLPTWSENSGDGNCFWNHQYNPPSCDVLATDYGSGKGWQYFTKYWFELEYRTDRIIIKVGDSLNTLRTIFDVTGHFEPGHFGFYNLSQNGVRYSNFTVVEGEPPSAIGDNYHFANRNQPKVPATKGVLANDSSSSTLNGLTVELGNPPIHGDLSLNPDGSFIYVPDNLHCTDSFTYRAFDGKKYSEYATVNLTMNTVSDLAASQLQYHSDDARLSVRIDNAGIVPSPTSLVKFYAVAPNEGGNLIGSVAIDSLQPGDFEKVVLENVADLSDAKNLYAVVDADRQIKECNKINNFIALHSDTPLTTPASCQLYAVHDEGPNNSQLFSINIQKEMEKTEVTNFGPLYEGYDIEALAIDPVTNIIYASSGHNTALGMPKGHLYLVDTQTDILIPVGSTGFEEVDSLAFSRDGTLWGWAKGDGLITIDPKTGEGTLELPSKVRLEDLTLGKQNGTVFYGAAKSDLWIYDKAANTLEVACTNLPGQIESLGLLSSNLLLLGKHGDEGLHFFDIRACELIGGAKIPTAAFNDVEGLIVPLEKCSIWNNLLKGVQKELPPKIPSELISDLPIINLSKLLRDTLREIITEYIRELSNEELTDFIRNLPQELPADYPDEFINDILYDLPVELQDKINEASIREFLDEHVTEHLTEVLADLQPTRFLPDALLRKPIAKIVSDKAGELIDDLLGKDKIPNYLISEFFSQFPRYLVDKMMEKYGDEE
jgi:hypothetical protein